jgi:hypothetical protein
LKRKEERAPFVKGRSVSLINPSRANDDQQDEKHDNKRETSAKVIAISHNDTASFFISSVLQWYSMYKCPEWYGRNHCFSCFA